MQHRFLKSQTIEILYRYIDSIIDKIQFESGNTHPSYTIMQSMPRKEFKDK